MFFSLCVAPLQTKFKTFLRQHASRPSGNASAFGDRVSVTPTHEWPVKSRISLCEYPQLVHESSHWWDYLRSLSVAALDAGRRNHVTSGVGTPVTLQTSTTVSPSCTVTSSLDRWSIISAGTVHTHTHRYTQCPTAADRLHSLIQRTRRSEHS